MDIIIIAIGMIMLMVTMIMVIITVIVIITINIIFSKTTTTTSVRIIATVLTVGSSRSQSELFNHTRIPASLGGQRVGQGCIALSVAPGRRGGVPRGRGRACSCLEGVAGEGGERLSLGAGRR